MTMKMTLEEKREWRDNSVTKECLLELSVISSEVLMSVIHAGKDDKEGLCGEVKGLLRAIDFIKVFGIEEKEV